MQSGAGTSCVLCSWEDDNGANGTQDVAPQVTGDQVKSTSVQWWPDGCMLRLQALLIREEKLVSQAVTDHGHSRDASFLNLRQRCGGCSSQLEKVLHGHLQVLSCLLPTLFFPYLIN